MSAGIWFKRLLGSGGVGIVSAMSTPGILVVTGASGSGKTATVRALEARALPGVRCYYFDAVGVPAAESAAPAALMAGRPSLPRSGLVVWQRIPTARMYTSSMARLDRHSSAALLREPAQPLCE